MTERQKLEAQGERMGEVIKDAISAAIADHVRTHHGPKNSVENDTMADTKAATQTQPAPATRPTDERLYYLRVILSEMNDEHFQTSQDVPDLDAALAELQERRKAMKHPVTVSPTPMVVELRKAECERCGGTGNILRVPGGLEPCPDCLARLHAEVVRCAAGVDARTRLRKRPA